MTFLPDVDTYQDYFPFGMVMSERSGSEMSAEYRFGFGGQEQDNELYGHGNSFTAEFWQYDTRLGRRWNVDPRVVTGVSGYATFLNSPLLFIDPNGDTTYAINTQGDLLYTTYEDNENLENAIVVVDEIGEEGVLRIKDRLDDGSLSLTDDVVEGIRSHGISYSIDEYFDFYDDHSEDYHDNSSSYRPADGLGPLVNENGSQLILEDGYMRIGGKRPTDRDPLTVWGLNYNFIDAQGELHTHASIGRLIKNISSGESYYITSGDGLKHDLWNSDQKPNSMTLDVIVEENLLILYRQYQVVFTINR